MVVLITLVVARGLKPRTNLFFVIFSLNILLYIAASFSSELVKTLDNALWSSRTSLLIADFIPLNFYLFTSAFIKLKPTERKFRIIRNGLFVITPIVAVTAFLPLAIKSTQRGHYGTTLDKVGPLLWVTLIFIVVVLSLSFKKLYDYGKKSDIRTKLQIRIMIYGIGAAVLINLITLIALPELHINFLGNIVGVPSDLLFVGSVGYAILRHKMFDIRATVLRSLGFALTIITILFIYSLTLLGISHIIFPSLTLPLLVDIFFLVTSIVLAVSFRPLIKLISKLTDNTFFRDQYDAQELMSKIGHVLASEIRLRVVSKQICELISQSLHTQTDIIILDESHIYFESGNYFKKELLALETDLLRLGDNMLVMDDLREGQQKSILRHYGINVFVTLKTHNEKIGYLLFSDKSSGASYTKFDLKTTQNIADELSIGFQNSRSFALVQTLNETLKNKINEAKKGLQEANEKLKVSDQVKDDFISMASHQLSTPLAVIDGYLTLANQGVYGELSQKLKNALSASAERAQVMKSLLVDLLDISRMTAGKFVLQIEPADINEVVAREFTQLKDLAGEKAVEYNYHSPYIPIPLINMDAQKTGQAVMNLMHNALHYAAGKKVDVYLSKDKDNVIFTVVDNGIGVPEEQKSKLFTKFYRATNAKIERPNGTGIGLYLVKRVVEDQGGKLIFSSTQDKGSTFGFSLPLQHKV
jgi:signal transduction histidine kinase